MADEKPTTTLKISPERMAEMVAQHEVLAAELLHTPEARAAYHRAAVERGRRMALVEAYWLLRDHAAEKRQTSSYVGWVATREDPRFSQQQRVHASDMARRIEMRCRGLEDGATDIASLLGVEEHEIERPAGTPKGGEDEVDIGNGDEPPMSAATIAAGLAVVDAPHRPDTPVAFLDEDDSLPYDPDDDAEGLDPRDNGIARPSHGVPIAEEHDFAVGVGGGSERGPVRTPEVDR
jgi:hypothetical protein